ncbi:glycosyltransferase family 32 protein [Marinobacter sp. 1Y8]
MNKTIHTIWLGKRMPPLVHACIDDWDKQGFSYRVWSEADTQVMMWIESCPFANACYKKGLYAFVSDYLRLKILQDQGGLYLDTDVTIRKDPFPLFEGYRFSVGYETERFLGTAAIYAEKESNTLAELITFYEDEIWRSPLYIGPQILSSLLLERNLCEEESKKLYPVDFFYNYQGENLNFKPPENSYLVHWFQNSWGSDKAIVFVKSKHMNLFGKFYVWQKYFFRRFFR